MNTELPPELDPHDAGLREKAACLRLMVFDFDGVFTDNNVYVTEDGREFVRCNRSDGLGLRLLESVGVTPIILSTEKNPVVLFRAKKLAIEARNALDDKRAALLEEAERRGLDLKEVWYLGNDINDAGCLQIAGLPVVVADSHEAVFPLAQFRTRKRGGEGAVREICDLVHSIRSSSSQSASLADSA